MCKDMCDIDPSSIKVKSYKTCCNLYFWFAIHSSVRCCMNCQGRVMVIENWEILFLVELFSNWDQIEGIADWAFTL